MTKKPKKIRVVTNKRTGKCKRCGKCCAGKILLHGNRKPGEAIKDVIKETVNNGFTVLKYEEDHVGGKYFAQWTMSVKCNSFKDGLCTRHGKSKPHCCDAYPFHSSSKLVRGCGFKWKKTVKWISCP